MGFRLFHFLTSWFYAETELGAAGECWMTLGVLVEQSFRAHREGKAFRRRAGGQWGERRLPGSRLQERETRERERSHHWQRRNRTQVSSTTDFSSCLSPDSCFGFRKRQDLESCREAGWLAIGQKWCQALKMPSPDTLSQPQVYSSAIFDANCQPMWIIGCPRTWIPCLNCHVRQNTDHVNGYFTIFCQIQMFEFGQTNSVDALSPSWSKRGKQ